jgi:thiamine-phosphate pyrophosphorylase
MNLSVYVIIDPTCCGGRNVVGIARAALKGGATMLQYRNKTGEHVARDAAALLKTCRVAGIPFLVNDYVEIARDIGADGVHIGQGDMSAAQAHEIMGADAIIGVTAFTANHIAAIDPDVVDYIGTGPFYPTQTDKGKPVLGAQRFAEFAAMSPVPVVGIGGITPDNAAPVITAGAQGVAMMRSVTEAQNPEAAMRAFVEAVKP